MKLSQFHYFDNNLRQIGRNEDNELSSKYTSTKLCACNASKMHLFNSCYAANTFNPSISLRKVNNSCFNKHFSIVPYNH